VRVGGRLPLVRRKTSKKQRVAMQAGGRFRFATASGRATEPLFVVDDDPSCAGALAAVAATTSTT
jgi:hypothetical protein